MTPALRHQHAGNWLAFYAAALRTEGTLNPILTAKRAAAAADAALVKMLELIPQLARHTEPEINPLESQHRARTVKGCISRTDAELLRLSAQIHDMLRKQSRRRAELERQSSNSEQ